MRRDVAKETAVTAKSTKRLIREGDFVAEVDAHLVEEEGGRVGSPSSTGA